MGKNERRAAAEAEIARRERERELTSPLSRAEMEALFVSVAERTRSQGLSRDFDATRKWLVDNDKLVDVSLEFLVTNGVACDWDVLVGADPHVLFGPTPSRLARMPLDRASLTDLMAWLETALVERGCDHTLRLSLEWLGTHALPIASTEFSLIAQGGGCDCEVLLNVDPDRIYPP